MSQISKCPKVTVILSYWEASGEVSKLRYKSLLYFSSKRSYCSRLPCYVFCICLSTNKYQKYLGRIQTSSDYDDDDENNGDNFDDDDDIPACELFAFSGSRL